MPENIDSATSENVRVVVRVRPLSEKEIAAQHKSIVEVDQIGRTISVFNPSCGATEPPKFFSFDAVFGPDSKQLDVYNEAARGIVANVLEGYNGTIFAYGQTGTGKTFTMEGIRETPELKGIIPNSFAHIFGHIAQGNENQKFLARVSYLEIYNEEVRDLLGKNQTARLDVKERPDVGVYVKDLSTYVVNTADDMDRIMALGNKNRSVGATNMNAHSSRSHAIFSITMEASERREGRHHVHMGKLHLVDLAGSERQSKTGASGQRLKEASKINLSLSTLGNVISALVDGKSTHIPYRNSKLTRLLQDALGGNAKTLMVANVGPAEYNYEETISTLRYANRAKNIKNKAKINEDPKDALLKQFQKEIEELKRQLQEGSGSEVSGSEEEDGSANADVKEKTKKKKKVKQMTEEEKAAIQAKIEFEKKLLIEGANMAEEEKLRVADQLARHKEELSEAQQAETKLRSKLQALEKKVLVGGENLLEKAAEQAKLLEEALKELEDRKQTQELLRKQLEEKEAERIDMEERYSSLQEEAVGKTRKLRKVATLLAGAKAEVQDLTREHQREMEALLEGVRHLTRDLRLQSLVIDSFIPQEYQEIIEQHVHWNDDIGEWQLKGVAYAGNNMRKPSSPVPRSAKKYRPEVDLSHVYLSYNDSSVSEPVRLRPKSRMRSASSRRSMHI